MFLYVLKAKNIYNGNIRNTYIVHVRGCILLNLLGIPGSSIIVFEETVLIILHCANILVMYL